MIMNYRQLFESAKYARVVPIDAPQTDYTTYIIQGFNDNTKLINDFVSSGAKYDKSLGWEKGSGAYYFYCDDDKNLHRVSIFDDGFKKLLDGKEQLAYADGDNTRQLSLEDWKKLMTEEFLYQKLYGVFSVYDLKDLMPQTRWHIGEIKVFGDNKVKADVKKLSKLNKYLFGDNNADFAAHTDLYDDEEMARPTTCDGCVLIDDGDEATALRVLLVNGNNGTTKFSAESLEPALKFCRFVEDVLNGRAVMHSFITHSDVHYYEFNVYIPC